MGYLELLDITAPLRSSINGVTWSTFFTWSVKIYERVHTNLSNTHAAKSLFHPNNFPPANNEDIFHIPIFLLQQWDSEYAAAFYEKRLEIRYPYIRALVHSKRPHDVHRGKGRLSCNFKWNFLSMLFCYLFVYLLSETWLWQLRWTNIVVNLSKRKNGCTYMLLHILDVVNTQTAPTMLTSAWRYHSF